MYLKELIKVALHTAEEASKAILEVYHSNDVQAELKGDQSPLTLADKNAHQVIEQILKETQLPILSEEGKTIPYEVRKQWEYFWMVDPLDGTKEFIKRNGEFTVNIALIHKQTPVLGVVAVPVTGDVYYATQGGGAFQKLADKEVALEKRKPIDLSQKGIRVVASRSHMNDETTAFIEELQAPELISAGSSLKFMLLATGQADVYPRFAPTMEWDTAAAHAIILETGMSIYQPDGNSLVYNKENLLNPYFLCH